MRLQVRNGKYSAECYYFDGERRRRKLRSTGITADGTAQSKRTAERIGRDIERSLALGKGVRARGATLRSAFAARIAAHRLNDHAQATIDITLEKGAHVLRYFGAARDVQGEPITDDELIAYATHARLKRQPPTVFRELVELRSALKSVRAPIPAMPALGKVQVPRELWFDHSQSAQLFALIPESRRDHFIAYRMLGLSHGELYKIEPKDIDFERHTVRVRGTKREKRDRVLPLPEQVEAVLGARSLRRPMFDLWDYGNGNRDLTNAAHKAGLVGVGVRVSFNVLRASYCTELILKGVHLKKIANLMGHQDTKMVERWYARLRAGEHLADVAAQVSSY